MCAEVLLTGGVSVLVNPIGADFNEAGICLHSLCGTPQSSETFDYLKTLDSGD